MIAKWPLRQNGYVVEDLDSALEYWTEKVGVGPFFRIDSVPLDRFEHAGSSALPDLNIALAVFGETQIELVHQVNDAASPYRDFSKAKGSGLHHVAIWSSDYDADADADADVERLKAQAGGEISGGVITGVTRFCYIGSELTDGTCIEVVEANESLAALHGAISAASAAWDGSDPVRVFPLAF